jgi:hypothetical protein
MVPKLYIVREMLEWGDYGQPEPLFGDGRMVSVHQDRASAEKGLREADAAKRETGDVSRLQLVGTHKELLALSDFDPPVFADWLTDGGLPPLRKKQFWEHWHPWLDGLTKPQRVHLLRGLHKLEFYEILEVDYIEGKYPKGTRDGYERGNGPGG